MASEFIQIKCPGCGAAVSTKDTECEYCGKPVMIKNFNSIASMSMPELNKYVGSYKREIDRNGDKKAFLSNKSTITQIETFINDAISIESKGVYYYFMAYIKFDYYKRKSFRTKPDYIECLNQAIRNNLSRMDAEQMFKIIGVTMPHELAF